MSEQQDVMQPNDATGRPIEKAANRNPLVAGGRAQAIVAQTDQDAWRIAVRANAAKILPKDMTVEQAYIAVLAGAEMGLPPMSSLKTIAIINNRPCIWGDGLIALAHGSGELEKLERENEGEGESRRTVVKVYRKGMAEPFVGEFSAKMARTAKLSGKPGPWMQYPERMIYMRARAYALREAFADKLAGLGVAEEAQDIPQEPPEKADTTALKDSFGGADTIEAEDLEIVEDSPRDQGRETAGNGGAPTPDGQAEGADKVGQAERGERIDAPPSGDLLSGAVEPMDDDEAEHWLRNFKQAMDLMKTPASVTNCYATAKDRERLPDWAEEKARDLKAARLKKVNDKLV